MSLDPLEILFVSVRGMSVSQLLVVVGALLSRRQLWTTSGAKEVSGIIGKVLLPIRVFLDLAKPEARVKLKQVFAASEGLILVSLSAGLMLTYLALGLILAKVLAGSSTGMRRAGNVVSISIGFGNATVLPVMLLGTVAHLFAEGDRVFLYLCVAVYGTINRFLIYTAGSAICSGKARLSVLANEVNAAFVLGLIVCFSQDLIGVDLMAHFHSPRNWIDVAGCGKALADMANPLLQLVSGASLAKGPKSEDLDGVSIAASSLARLVLCTPICYAALAATGVTTSNSSSMKVIGFVLLMESGMPAASRLTMVAIDSGVAGALQNVSTLLFYHSMLCPLTCTVVIAFALSLFATA